MAEYDEPGVCAFTLVLEGTDPLTEAHLNALYQAGCGDATFGSRGALHYADFARRAPTFGEAVESAILAVERAVPGLRVVRVEPEDLVSQADIAARTGRSRESVRLLIEAKRGPGHFPEPVVWVGRRRRLWSWHAVANWYARFLGETPDLSTGAAFITALNAALDLRRYALELPPGQERTFVARVVKEDEALLSA